jgi:dienelactone hydrolase
VRLFSPTIVAVLALCAAGCTGEDAGSGCPTEGCELQETRTLSYSSPASALRTMDVVAPTQDGSWPVVVVAHGAGGTRVEMRDWATGIAEQGAITYNVSWPAGTTLPDQGAAERLACAMRVAAADAADHGADTSRVVFVGHSLGAAVGAAVSLGGAPASGDCAAADGDSLPDAFVGYEGPYDHADIDYLNGAVPRDPPGDEATDPYAQIGGNPKLVVRLLHGDVEDSAWYDVPMNVSEEFAQALTDAGYDAKLTIVEGGDHAPIDEGTPPQQAVVTQVTELLTALRSASG